MEHKTESGGEIRTPFDKKKTNSVNAGAETAASQFCLAPCPECTGVCKLFKEHPEQQHLCSNGHRWWS